MDWWCLRGFRSHQGSSRPLCPIGSSRVYHQVCSSHKILRCCPSTTSTACTDLGGELQAGLVWLAHLTTPMSFLCGWVTLVFGWGWIARIYHTVSSGQWSWSHLEGEPRWRDCSGEAEPAWLQPFLFTFIVNRFGVWFGSVGFLLSSFIENHANSLRLGRTSISLVWVQPCQADSHIGHRAANLLQRYLSQVAGWLWSACNAFPSSTKARWVPTSWLLQPL